jgi:hypothetical protein
MSVRDDIVDFLRKELTGPAPGLPFTQLDGEEVLPPEAPPRLRYGVGILFPTRMDVAVQEDAEAEAAAPSKDEDNAFRAEESELTGETHPDEDVRGEGQSESDQEVNRTNEFLPSAMGFTALVRVNGAVVIDVSAARYVSTKVADTVWKGKETSSPAFWFRRPISEPIEIPSEELLVEDPVVITRLIDTGDDGALLQLHLLVRSPKTKIEGAQANDRFLTVTLINRTLTDTHKNDDKCFFQCHVRLSVEDSESTILEYPEHQIDENTPVEDLSLQLLYRHKQVYAVGHGCSADWSDDSAAAGPASVCSTTLPEYEIKPILPTQLPDVDLTMRLMASSEEDALSSLKVLCTRYLEWIDKLDAEIATDVPRHLEVVAREHARICRECHGRMVAGVELLERQEDAMNAFLLMNRAMVMQHAHYELSTNEKRRWIKRGIRLELEETYSAPEYGKSDRSWHPFQIAFIIMTICSVFHGESPDPDERSVVDLIWFPTGGGKTEAYLGLIAFTILSRRLDNPDNAGTTALMRYTLRLLTTQQFQRAASLICALEVIRREPEADLGSLPITIGLWVGGGVTPNREKDAKTALGRITKGKKENPFIILACPWCGAQMGPVKSGNATKVRGYRKVDRNSKVRLICEDTDCVFCDEPGLPLLLIDEHIYSDPPTLVVGTVDKFALLPWYPQAKSLFGVGMDAYDPPDLIVQDELHLISGPLGSMVGHYETVIDALCRKGDVPAKIVASTATISRANQQIRDLYGGRKSMLFPPQGLRAGESFFAEERHDRRGRKYVGVFATGLPSMTTTEIRVLSALLQAPKCASYEEPEEINYYWTLMVYFNSIRELGHAATLIRADISEYLDVLWRRLGLTKQWGADQLRKRRYINNDMELTSRIQNSEITEYMEQLFTDYDDSKKAWPVDICVATNMIQVGLDVPRLSLMTMVGQPKTTAEYIQASSRVGRSGDGPGLVVTMLSPAKPRDRSHAEHFRAFHESIYRYVEPTSVTPFAIPVTERAIHALVFTLCRYWGDADQALYPEPPAKVLRNRVRDEIVHRVKQVDPKEEARVVAQINALYKEWDRLPPDVWGGFSPTDDQVPFMYPAGTNAADSWDQRSLQTPSSMRNVDANCDARVISDYLME